MNDNLEQKLHPNKKLINKVFAGIDFVGFIVKPNRILLRQHTLKRVYLEIKKWKISREALEQESLRSFFKTMNSYIGMLTSIDGYIIRKDLCLNVINLFLRCDGHFSKLVLL